ncbi:MAG: hypothetical protein AMDU2_EPLC00006G0139 [Thermoplasmatales archaeon E-plasma]|jgi:hypothetical protein|nr:MAG: hypothetical protein AMDU2_EPLC00006G0139 [Thermoplasmatales archaeon E-plasma]
MRKNKGYNKAQVYRMKKNTFRIFAILEVIVIVFAGITYFELYDHKYASVNNTSPPLSNITYPTRSLAGATEIYNFHTFTGLSLISFNVPNGTKCLVFLMYANDSIVNVCITNSTGCSIALLSINQVSENFVGERIPFYTPITGNNTENWHIIDVFGMENQGSYNLKIYSANSVLWGNQCAGQTNC